MKRDVNQCPVCDAALQVTELSCTRCETRLVGVFPPPPLARLPLEQQRFVEVFLRCRGVLRDVERALGVSYPTVRARLDAAVDALEDLTPPPSPPLETSRPNHEEKRRKILQAVAEGRTDAAEAALLLRRLGQETG
jgi:hypothetical protein